VINLGPVTLIDDLLAHPGLYVGLDRDADDRGVAAARILVTPLPGRGGVTLDYETFMASAEPERVRAHAEHSILARTPKAGPVLIVGHVHADTIAILHEEEPGFFVAPPDASPFPIAIRMSMPEPGHLLHSWFYGAPGEEAVERDIADLRLLP
jgi:hypothetical protein